MAKALILHGGAGTWRYSERSEKAVEAVQRCTENAWRILVERNNALDAVVEAVKCMEDSGYLNAGWGSVPDLFGDRGLDAGVMASNGLLGAVGDVRATRNPVVLARIVAEETPHVLLVGSGADQLARYKNLPPLPPPPDHVLKVYREFVKKLVRGEPPRPYIVDTRRFLERNREFNDLLARLVEVYDTVGACAVDDNGLLVAGVSTGGLILKLPGRVGDSAIPGAGFYASDKVACSATGIGEKIIRSIPCRKLSEYMEQGMSFDKALDETLRYVDRVVGGDTVGFIAVDLEGNVGWRYNTEAILVGVVERGEVRAWIDHR